MDDSLDRHAKGSTPRTLMRRFMKVMEVQDTPTPIKKRRVTEKHAQMITIGGKRTLRSIPSTSGQGDVHHQSKPSTSFMNQSLNVSVIQGINQTYANIVAPDSDSSSLNATPDIKKARKRHTKNKRKLEVASLPADMIPKPPPKKIKSSAVPPTDTSTASISKEVVSGGKDSNTTYIMGEETQHDKQQTQTKGSSTEVASVKAGTKKTLHALTLSPNISSISALSAESDGTYDFTMEDDDTFSNIIETKQKLSKQVASRKLNLPSVIEALQKTKTTESKIAANVETSVAPSVQASTSATSPQASHEAVKERSKLNKTYQDTDYDFIPPPQSFRDDEIATAETMHEADGSNDGGKNDDVEPINQEGFDVPQEEDKGGVVHQDASTGQRESVDQATATTFITTPTRSAQRKSVGQASTITTPTRSSSRKSVGQVSVATSTSPIRSAQRRSVGRVSVGTSITPNMSAGGEIIATPARSSQGKSVGGEVIATPTKSSQRKSVGGEVIVPPTRSSQRKSVGGEVITTPTRSSQRNSMGGEVNATPTKSSQRKSVGGEVIATPTRSSQRKSVGGEVIATPTRSSQRRSVGGEVITTPTRSSQRKSVGGEVITTLTRSSQRKSAGGEVITTPTRSSQRKSMGGEVIATPTRSSQRKSVGSEVIATPTRSSQRKSVGGEVITRPTRSSQRKSVGSEVIATSTRSSQRKSVGGEVIATPTRSSQRKSAGEVIATPTKSSQRKSVGSEVIATPTGSSQRKSVGSEVIATIITTTPPTATPINLTPKVDVGRNTESMLMSPQTGDGMKDTSATGSTVRSKMSQASNAEQQGTSAITSMPSPAENKDVAAVSPQREQDTHDVQESGEAAQGGSSDHESDDIVLPLSNEDESPNKKKRIGNDLPEDVAEEPLPEDAIEEAPLTDREDEISYSPVSAKQSSQASNRNVSTSSIVDVQKGETSLSKSNAVPKPKEQSLPSTSTGRVRQMTMREYLVQLKTKPMPPPFAKPKPLLANVFGTTTRTKSPSKAPQRQKQKRSKKLTDLPTTFSRSITKELFTHFAKCRVTSAAVDEVVRSSEMFWQNLTRDMSAITSARKETQHIEARDIEKLMKRQGVITSKQSLNALVEELLPTEMWKLFMPFPNAAKNPFQPFTGPLFNPEKATGLEEDESEGELDG